MICGRPKPLNGPSVVAMVAVGPPLPVKMPMPPASSSAWKATVPPLLIEGGPENRLNGPSVEAMVAVAPPLPVKMPWRTAVKATVPPSLIEGTRKPLLFVPVAMVVVAPPLPVKMPTPPVSRPAKKTTVPPLLTEGGLPIVLNGPDVSAMLVKV